MENQFSSNPFSQGSGNLILFFPNHSSENESVHTIYHDPLRFVDRSFSRKLQVKIRDYAA
jgi:hypothetical protein